MASNYAPNQFFRQAKISLLQDYFTRRKTLEDMEWDKLKETETKLIYDAWQTLAEQTREEMEFKFRQVHDMATANGARAIIEEGHFHGLDLTADLDAQDGYINKALWTLLAHPGVFDIAQIMNRADHLNGRHWHRRKDVLKKAPEVSAEVLKELADAISAYYRENQGRGRHCWAETYLRGGRYHYFFVYPQDYTDTFIEFDDDGRFQRRPYSPAFEVIYVYDPEDGTLDLYVQGDKSLRRDLQELFGRAILKADLGEEKRDSVPYDLNGLKRRDLSFPTDPSDRIKGVKITAMRLSMLGNPRKRITFETGPKDQKEGIYNFIEASLHEQRLPLSMVNVSSAVIQMTFENTKGSRRDEKTLSFRITHPNSCNLKDSPEELVAKKYLKEWKIETS
jgi:hypothetical protein